MSTYHHKGKNPPSHYRKIGAFDIDGTLWSFWLRPPNHRGMVTIKLVAATPPAAGKANHWAMHLGRLMPWGASLNLPTESPGLWAAAEDFTRGHRFRDALIQLRDGEQVPRPPRPPHARPNPRYAHHGALAGGWDVYLDQQAPDPTHWANILLWGPEYSYRLGWSLAEVRTARTAQDADLQRRHPDVYTDLIRYLRGLRHG